MKVVAKNPRRTPRLCVMVTLSSSWHDGGGVLHGDCRQGRPAECLWVLSEQGNSKAPAHTSQQPNALPSIVQNPTACAMSLQLPEECAGQRDLAI